MLDFVSLIELYTSDRSLAHSYDVSNLKKQNMCLERFMKVYVGTIQEQGHLFKRQFAKAIFGPKWNEM